jgi:hypothetical protein
MHRTRALLPLLFLFLLGCPTADDDDTAANDDDTSVDDDDAVNDDDTADDDAANDDDSSDDDDATSDDDDATSDDDDATPFTVSGSTLADAGLCPAVDTSTPPAPGPFTTVTDASLFGTGTVNDVVLGALDDASAIAPAPQAGSVSYGFDLDVESFDLYVPPDYDGSEAYGLLVHIDAGNNGSVRGSWTDVLDEEKLIWVGGDGIGNSVNVDLRMGKATMGAYRALELFNIDLSRVYATGNSGGARSAHVASFLHPSLYTAALPLCGAGWFHEVEQSYETQEPGSHYEFWGSYFYPAVGPQPFGDWLASYLPRQAFLTSFDDFREGDIQNVYHHGATVDGFPTRLLEVAGGHCATSADHARDGLAWIQSPDFSVVDDGLNDGDLATSPAGHGLVDAGPEAIERASETELGLWLRPEPSAPAHVIARDRVQWLDPAGAVISAEVRPDPIDGLAGARATVGVWAWNDAVAVDDLAGTGSGGPAVLVWAEDAGTPQLVVGLRGTDGSLTEALRGDLFDWDNTSSLSVEINVWSEELQVRTNHHVDNATTASWARLLDDQRILRVRWSEVPAELAPAAAWDEGGIVVLSAESLGDAVPPVRFGDLVVRDATGTLCP